MAAVTHSGMPTYYRLWYSKGEHQVTGCSVTMTVPVTVTVTVTVTVRHMQGTGMPDNPKIRVLHAVMKFVYAQKNAQRLFCSNLRIELNAMAVCLH
jgi:hypothetical protein